MEQGVAILFATGAVSGTMLSFELGLLWPGFMKHAGPIFRNAFFIGRNRIFIEAIAIGFFFMDGTSLINGFIGSADFW
jgi:cytochrome d ubiquinol oxidase subunit I